MSLQILKLPLTKSEFNCCDTTASKPHSVTGLQGRPSGPLFGEKVGSSEPHSVSGPLFSPEAKKVGEAPCRISIFFFDNIGYKNLEPTVSNSASLDNHNCDHRKLNPEHY